MHEHLNGNAIAASMAYIHANASQVTHASSMRAFIVLIMLGLSAARPPSSLWDRSSSLSLWDKRPPSSLWDRSSSLSLWDKRPPSSLWDRSSSLSLWDKRPPSSLQQVVTPSPVPFDIASAQSRSVLACGSHSLSAGSYTIQSPNHPSNYDINYDCFRALTGASGVASLSISCSSFSLEVEPNCSWDWLSVNGNKFCGTSGPSVSSATLNITFHSDYSVVSSGYKCTIQAEADSCSCGVVNRAARIVGGVETEANEYPWQAGLVSPGQTRTWCGGSLINDRYVLTAAHCTNGQVASQIQVLLGDHRISVADGESRHTVAQIIQDTAYTSVASGHDYSLLKLSAPVTFNTRRRPVCLPTAGNTYAGASAIATGFGGLGTTDPQATTLQEVVLPVRSDSECSSYWSVRPTTICAGGLPEGGKSVCMGDSGGPLVTLENSKYALIGVVSYGRACAHPNYPDVFARVTAALSWIQTNTADATYCT